MQQKKARVWSSYWVNLVAWETGGNGFRATIMKHHWDLLFLSHSGTRVAFDIIWKGGTVAGRRHSYYFPWCLVEIFLLKVSVSLYNYLVTFMHAVSSPKNGWHLSATKLIWMWCNGHNCFLEKSHLCDSVLEPKLYAQSFLRAPIHQIPFAYFPKNAVSQEEDSAFLFDLSIGSHKKVQKMTEKNDFLLLESCGYRIFQKKKSMCILSVLNAHTNFHSCQFV